MSVSTREYFERIIVEHDKTHAAEHAAVQLQAAEYARRLEDLNHAHERSVEDRVDFVLKVRYEADQASHLDWAEAAASAVTVRFENQAQAVDQRLRPLEKLATRATLLFPGGALVGALVLYILEKAIH